MDIVTKDRWAAELRSDTYKQIHHTMSDGCNGRCVLGVLAEVLGLKLTVDDNTLAYAKISKMGVNTGEFWFQNDHFKTSFEDFADQIDAATVDDPLFNYDPAKYLGEKSVYADH